MGKVKVYEQGDRYYFFGPVSPVEPGQDEINEFAFAESIQQAAPNEHINWFRGQYVEADVPNANRQQWTADEIAIKHLTPNFMPVTVMHDPRTAVGLIADTALLTPEADSVPNARIDTTLAVWAHRFPEIVEEARENYKSGTLMQSMEALSPHYSCSECGQLFHKLPGGAEQANWCGHLKGDEGEKAARILGNVTFTGTGLIFGTRNGARGANGKAYLEMSAEELAERHEEAHEAIRTQSSAKKKSGRANKVEIEDSKYQELVGASQRLEAAEKEKAELEGAKTEAESKIEQAEAEITRLKAELETAQGELNTLKEEKSKSELANERLDKVNKGFIDSLGEFTSKRLREQASEMADEEWEARLTELEELTGKKRDAEAEGGSGGGASTGGSEGASIFDKGELARAGVHSPSGVNPNQEPTIGERSSVIGGLMGAKK